MPTTIKPLDYHVSQALNNYGLKLEKYFGCDVIAYVGGIYPAVVPQFLEQIEGLQSHNYKQEQLNKNTLTIVLSTPGGIVEAVEKMVEITRHYYSEVFFIVPDAAMSAGTIWCLSGDKIYMDYASSLGPIDPQVQAQDGRFVPALGYIDKVNEFIEKVELSSAELMLLRSLDLGVLRRFEQARELSMSLLREWLVTYKFKDWHTHQTTKKGQEVTQLEKAEKANEIATKLSNNKKWYSHGRMIGIETLHNDIGLKIEDYSAEKELRNNIRMYNGLLSDYLEKQGIPVIIHNARV